MIEKEKNDSKKLSTLEETTSKLSDNRNELNTRIHDLYQKWLRIESEEPKKITEIEKKVLSKIGPNIQNLERAVNNIVEGKRN